jgi:hypothetical protein
MRTCRPPTYTNVSYVSDLSAWYKILNKYKSVEKYKVSPIGQPIVDVIMRYLPENAVKPNTKDKHPSRWKGMYTGRPPNSRQNTDKM